MLVARFRQSLAVLLLLGLTACAANGPVLSAGVGAMRASVAQSKTASDAAFTDINASRRGFTIEDVLDANRAPKEEDFAPVIANDTIGRWDQAFDKIDEYLAALQDLVDTKRSAETRENLTAIGTALQSETIGVKLPKGAEAVFAALGSALVQAVAENKALDIMRRTDPAFQRLTRKMGDLVYSPDEGTLSAMIIEQWTRRLRDIAADDYGAAAAKGSREGRIAAIQAYGKALDERNAKLAGLASLRDSLLALGEAHAAAAKGSDSALLYWIGQIDARLKEARKAAEQGGK